MKPCNLAVTYTSGGTMFYHFTTRKEVANRAKELGLEIEKIEQF